MRRHIVNISSLRSRFHHSTQSQRLAILRMTIGGYALLFLIIRFPHLWNSASYPKSRWDPIGVLVPLSEAPSTWLFRSLLMVAIPLGISYVLGWRYRITGPLFSLLFLAITTFRFSWGSVLHTEHLVVVHLLIVGFSTADHAWALRGTITSAPSNIHSHTYSWAIETCAIATVIGYTVSGIAKFRYGGLDWLSGDVLRNQIAFDNLRKIMLGDIHSPLARWLVNNDAPLKLFAPLTILFEICAPFALLHRTARKVWVVGIWLFHVGVLALMAIVFPYQLLTVAYLPVMLMTPFLQRRPQRNSSSRALS